MIGFTSDMLVRGRELARTRMRATVLIHRVTGSTRNPETGKVEPVTEVVYAGVAELRMRSALPVSKDSAGQRVGQQEPILVLPVDGDEAADAAQLRYDDQGVVLTDLDNEGNVGKTFRVAGPHLKSLATARRLPVEVNDHAGQRAD